MTRSVVVAIQNLALEEIVTAVALAHQVVTITIATVTPGSRLAAVLGIDNLKVEYLLKIKIVFHIIARLERSSIFTN